ncbi:MAG: aspartate kinase [Planctomycetaceae bacterium]|nr:aspartate kinase [Planctomycetaceae bacterium]
MSIIVQKFGGTSVADSQKILSAARKAIRAKNEGNQVVMVVSAMGKTTDVLVDLAGQISDDPPAREMDMLLSTGEQVTVALMAMAINSLGHEAISMTGGQLGIRTDSTHTKARIHSIDSQRIHAALDGGKVVIAAGFQGVDESSNITTLGRGGSDTTAVAIAAAVGAASCEIYTDVDGVYTTDPRLVPEARRVPRISYDEMLELASLGAGVMHNRSIEFAKRFGATVHVRSSFSDDAPGTVISSQPESLTRPVCGAALIKDEAWVTVQGVPDRPGAASTIFSKIAGKKIGMDMIVQNVGAEGQADISFSVFRADLARTLKAVEEACEELGAGTYTCDDNVSKVSVVGLNMATQTGVAERMFRALAEKGINLQMITTSEIKISVLVAREYAVEALRTVHEVFGLSQPPEDAEETQPEEPLADKGRNGVLARLHGMEDLIIDEISLDVSQARVTLPGVPDTPGLAAQVFDEIAESGTIVDMIVQSIGRQGQAALSFTVAKEHLEKCLGIATSLAEGFGGQKPTSSPEVAKLSVSGIGMRSHTSVAQRTFQSLADNGINIEMISTSEVRMNVVVDGQHGHKALELLQKEFKEAMA